MSDYYEYDDFNEQGYYDEMGLEMDNPYYDDMGIESGIDLMPEARASYSDTQRTGYSSIFESNHKYLVLGIRTTIRDYDFIDNQLEQQIIYTLSENETKVQNIDFLNPRMLVFGFYCVKNKKINEKQLKKLLQHNNIEIDDVIRYSNLIIEKFL